MLCCKRRGQSRHEIVRRIRSVSESVGEPRGNQGGRQYGVAGLGHRGTVKSQFGSVATQSVEKPCILLDCCLGRGREAAEELQLMMGKEAGTERKSVCVSNSFREASKIRHLTLEGENGACQLLYLEERGRISLSGGCPQGQADSACSGACRAHRDS